ncbi:MAG TPA: glycosyltransferase [Gemmatimonadales bacterium]|nr:glycosyltransferase [Gemmatimonadales bacterium]
MSANLLQRVPVAGAPAMEEYAGYAHLAPAVAELRAEGRELLARLGSRTVWLVNSTAVGGGVAEMLPTIVRFLRNLGIRTEWVTIGSRESGFFELTKHVHNLVHGEGDPELGDAERRLFERVNQENAQTLASWVRTDDILVVHEPQPLPLAFMLRDRLSLAAVWRCHIGVDTENAATRAAWSFLDPYLTAYDRAVFSAPEYIPPRLAGRATVILPGIDPLASKNRDLSIRDTIEVLSSSGMILSPGPMVGGYFAQRSRWLHADGTFRHREGPDGFALLSRPLVTQVSRWDRLKGFLPLLRAFARLKAAHASTAAEPGTPARSLALAGLLLAGPDPGSVQDDPEAAGVLEELRAAYLALPTSIQSQIAIVTTPLHHPEESALLVNALQRASTIVVQNSLREGFGLTITEAMWKGLPVLSNSRACGPRQQIRDGMDGMLVRDPEDEGELERALATMLADAQRLRAWGRTAQRRAFEEFLVFRQLRQWGRLLLAMLPV